MTYVDRAHEAATAQRLDWRGTTQHDLDRLATLHAARHDREATKRAEQEQSDGRGDER